MGRSAYTRGPRARLRERVHAPRKGGGCELPVHAHEGARCKLPVRVLAGKHRGARYRFSLPLHICACSFVHGLAAGTL